MLRFLISRLLQAIPVLLAVITVAFILMHVAPGGPFASEKKIPQQILDNLNKKYHLDDPLPVQYIDYIKNVAMGDFGPSFKYPGRSVNELIASGFPVTMELGLYALIVALLIGILAGVFASLKPNTWQDYLPMSFAMTGICVPTLLLGPLLVLAFAIHVPAFPVAGWDSFSYKVLPAITLGTAYAAYIARLSRGGMLEVLHQDFINTARAKGLKERVVIIKHALKGGLLPVISFMGPAAAGLLSGSFVVETVFQVPGLGRHFVQAAFNRDYTMIMGTAIFYATLIIGFNLLSDIAQVWVNPKLSFQTAKK